MDLKQISVVSKSEKQEEEEEEKKTEKKQTQTNPNKQRYRERKRFSISVLPLLGPFVLAHNLFLAVALIYLVGALQTIF